MRPSLVYAYPLIMQKQLSRRNSSINNDIKKNTCDDLWEQYYACTKHASYTDPICYKLYNEIKLLHKCPYQKPTLP